MNSDRIRIGLVGAGNNTRRRHIPGFRALGGVEFVAVANRTRESGARVAQEFGIPRVYDRWEQVIEDRDVDAVCIGTWPYLHAAVTLAALEHGKHVLCEARMAMNATEARTMLSASHARPDRVTQLVPAPHTLPVDPAASRRFRQRKRGMTFSAKRRSESRASSLSSPPKLTHVKR